MLSVCARSALPFFNNAPQQLLQLEKPHRSWSFSTHLSAVGPYKWWRYAAAGVDKASNLEYREFDVTVTDLRSASQSFNLRDNGFQLEKLEVPKDVDWQNDEQASHAVTS